MATRTINLTEGAYTRLAALKRGGESFSDVVNRITGKFALHDIVGILDEKEGEAFERAARDVGTRLRRTLGGTRKAGR